MGRSLFTFPAGFFSLESFLLFLPKIREGGTLGPSPRSASACLVLLEAETLSVLNKLKLECFSN